MVASKDDDEDDFLGFSSKPSKPHVRKHVDQDFDDFDTVPQQTSRRAGGASAEAGSFWDDNAGEDADDWDTPAANTNANANANVPTSVSSASSRPAPKKDGIDNFLDGLGNMLNITISDNVHEGVKSRLERL